METKPRAVYDVELTRGAQAYMLALVATGLYGMTVGQVLESLVNEGLRSAVANRIIPVMAAKPAEAKP